MTYLKTMKCVVSHLFRLSSRDLAVASYSLSTDSLKCCFQLLDMDQFADGYDDCALFYDWDVGLPYTGGTLHCSDDCSWIDTRFCTHDACGDGKATGLEYCGQYGMIHCASVFCSNV